jgi:hypothetical protein
MVDAEGGSESYIKNSFYFMKKIKNLIVSMPSSFHMYGPVFCMILVERRMDGWVG